MQNNNYKISKFINVEKAFRASYVNASAAVQDMQKIQNTFPLATMMVGRSMVAAVLLASQLKQNEMVSLYFRGNGPMEMVFAEATYEGAVRGYTTQPHLELPLRHNKLDLPSAIGRGQLTVVRTHAQRPQPYRGMVEIQSGEVGDDVAFYLQQSQQIPSVVSLGVKLDSYGRVESAGGMIIEMMPGSDIETEKQIAQGVKTASSLSEALANGAGASEILAMYLKDLKMIELDHPYHVLYSCKCNEERLIRSLQLLALEDLNDIVEKKEPIKAKCEFCGKSYQFSFETAVKIRDQKYKGSLH